MDMNEIIANSIKTPILEVYGGNDQKELRGKCKSLNKIKLHLTEIIRASEIRPTL